MDRPSLDKAFAHLSAYQDAVRPRLSCRGIGCTGCCSGGIPVTDPEWARVRPHVTRAQRNHARLIDPENPTARCPLLDGKGRCSVYEVRPLICRSFTSTAPVARCDPHARGEGPTPEPGGHAALRTAHRLAGIDPDTATSLAGRLAALTDAELRA